MPRSIPMTIRKSVSHWPRRCIILPTCSQILARDIIFQGYLSVVLCVGGIEECERSDKDEEEVEERDEGAATASRSPSHLDTDAVTKPGSEGRGRKIDLSSP